MTAGEAGDRSPPAAFLQQRPAAEPVVLFPRANGDDLGTLEFVRCKGEYTIVDEPKTSGAEHAKAKASKGRLLCATQELVAPVHLSGHYEVTIRVASDGRTVHGRGLSTDVVDASAKAYVDALNKLAAGVGRTVSDNKLSTP